uniref:Uncharacterized protein n=1 Tax=Caudovirales sp. ctIZM3 TaxID=2827633 RepID=A0A8S5T808_9CAUD|nr:MAG TPA: hypothetical protein [Caudovirales sp. ctIZM3]
MKFIILSFFITIFQREHEGTIYNLSDTFFYKCVS